MFSLRTGKELLRQCTLSVPPIDCLIYFLKFVAQLKPVWEDAAGLVTCCKANDNGSRELLSGEYLLSAAFRDGVAADAVVEAQQRSAVIRVRSY